jgi:hypothetical protein
MGIYRIYPQILPQINPRATDLQKSGFTASGITRDVADAFDGTLARRMT